MLFQISFTFVHKACCCHLIDDSDTFKLGLYCTPSILYWKLYFQEQEKRAQLILAGSKFLEFTKERE